MSTQLSFKPFQSLTIGTQAAPSHSFHVEQKQLGIKDAGVQIVPSIRSTQTAVQSLDRNPSFST